ncbi:MAG TPA: 50S ribosomal protein L1 [Deltaproteobacteria bacterium]|jgi:large subunit ribosomal protein L1|nr:50S ribosomal protein L1 [Deltaproteobacteria bacterium]OQC28300.1 MAG: 50S ribosomal protein L1 [Deltaproteobacteria bacterium ADurb.Bin072]HRW80949.1 50S ribosomal protein L1 [Desulfomonilia bacterium]HNQ86700.1 50S ribosomal protein L1 [Deltaproteobacteria bacterium]HNS90981.1 50S ribosomal protein L1 [Deltaproteobacteria bacterium]
MARCGKKYTEARDKVDPQKKYELGEALALVVDNAFAKFDESVDVALRLGVDPRHADQMVRGSVVLPHGTGKTTRVLVFAKGEKEKEAREAGADHVGAEDLAEKIQGGWLEFDKVIATPDLMGTVGKLGKVLGPRGMMPNPKLGTVTFDVAKAVADMKAGRVDFRVDKVGIVHCSVGKVSFGKDKILDNFKVLLEMIMKLKPSGSKGTYVKGVAVSSTMGPGVRIDPSEVSNILK